MDDVAISYSKSSLQLGRSDHIMTLTHADTGLNVSFMVSKVDVDMGCEAFHTLRFDPAMRTLFNEVTRRG